MGITIHYKGALKSVDMIAPLLEELVDIAETMEWDYTTLDEDFGQPNTAELVHDENGAEIIGNLPLKGISLSIHKKCESLQFFFDKNGILRDPIQMAFSQGHEEASSFLFVKTQFAPPDAHITIIKLLKYLSKKYFTEFEVYDEGNYWETEDENVLSEKLDFLTKKIDQVVEILKNVGDELRDADTPESLADKIEKLLLKKLNSK
ncbi:MAG: hypothetical protein GXO75_00535 [Calditrichaeota bacterium]|nr:hypothetical protein [Calditrichota bacterium]